MKFKSDSAARKKRKGKANGGGEVDEGSSEDEGMKGRSACWVITAIHGGWF